MNDLLSVKGITDFERLLAAYAKAGINLENALDGGAGSGATAKSMLRHLRETSRVYAFEPFPGNHRFFADSDPRVVLIPKALAEENKTMSFGVPSIVSNDSEWGKRGMAGYSSGGRLLSISSPTRMRATIPVECVRGDEVIPENETIGFIKLDLQGGELNALKGMPRLLRNASLLWIEYLGNDLFLLDYLIDSDFIVFDTEYMFIGTPTAEAMMHFRVTRQNVPLSNNTVAWFGFKKKPWDNFKAEFKSFKDKFKMAQTDLAGVNRRNVDQFLEAARYL